MQGKGESKNEKRPLVDKKTDRALGRKANEKIRKWSAVGLMDMSL